MRFRTLFLLLVCALALLLSPALYAQANGSFSGTVLDKSGSAISGAKVTATSVERGITYTAVTNEGGLYRISQLPVASASRITVASALDFGPRPKVVVSDFEFPTVGQIWHAQELRGVEVVHVPADGAEIPLERFAEAIDERTALVAVTAVCFRNGSRLPVEEIAELAHARGALVLLDAYQAAGSYPLDVAALGVDFLAAGTLKYLLASAGLGFIWCRHELIERLVPTQTGWFADRNIFEMDIPDSNRRAVGEGE